MKIGVHFLHGKKMKMDQIKTQYEFFPGSQRQGEDSCCVFMFKKNKSLNY